MKAKCYTYLLLFYSLNWLLNVVFQFFLFSSQTDVKANNTQTHTHNIATYPTITSNLSNKMGNWKFFFFFFIWKYDKIIVWSEARTKKNSSDESRLKLFMLPIIISEDYDSYFTIIETYYSFEKSILFIIYLFMQNCNFFLYILGNQFTYNDDKY